jgi:hypothetical protein
MTWPRQWDQSSGTDLVATNQTSPLMRRGFQRSRGFSHELKHPCHHLIERNAGVDFVPGASAQQRLHGVQEFQCPPDLLRSGSIGIVRPRGQPFDDDVGGRTEQDDVVELWIERPLVWGTPGQEQHVGVGSGQEGLDAIFSPDPVLSAIEPCWLVVRDTDHFGQAPVVGVDGRVAACGEFRNYRRFPGS